MVGLSDLRRNIGIMTTLNWRTVAEIRFTKMIIPMPHKQGYNTAHLRQVSIAIEGGFIHVDPRSAADMENIDVPADIFILPSTAVESIKYTEPEAPSITDSIF